MPDAFNASLIVRIFGRRTGSDPATESTEGTRVDGSSDRFRLAEVLAVTELGFGGAPADFMLMLGRMSTDERENEAKRS